MGIAALLTALLHADWQLMQPMQPARPAADNEADPGGFAPAGAAEDRTAGEDSTEGRIAGPIEPHLQFLQGQLQETVLSSPVLNVRIIINRHSKCF